MKVNGVRVVTLVAPKEMFYVRWYFSSGKSRKIQISSLWMGNCYIRYLICTFCPKHLYPVGRSNLDNI